MSERNIKIVVEYRGTGFSGWQYQPEEKTVQGELESAIKKVTGQKVNLLGAGRTDAGVHALGQVANFKIDHDLAPERFAEALNYYLPDEILVKESSEVPAEFHARYDAKFRRYRYLVSGQKSALYRHFRWFYPYAIDYGKLQEVAIFVLGEHDFAPFCVVSSRRESNVCNIRFSRWYQFGDLLIYEIRGNRFLHSMVRSLVGAMLNLARKEPDNNPDNLTLDAFKNILETSSEERITFTAPAHGLYLVTVGY